MKNNLYRFVSGIIFPIVFVALFFIIGGTEHGTTCWIGFGATLLVYMILIAVPLFIPNSQSSYLFGLTSGTITSIFFVVQFIMGLVFMISDFEEWKIAVIIEIIFVAVSVFLLIQLLRVDEVTAKKENNHQQEVYSVKNLVIKTQTIINRAPNSEIKRCVKAVYDELNSCPTSSNSNVKVIDNNISYALDSLNQAVISSDLNNVKKCASSLVELAKERKALSR